MDGVRTLRARAVAGSLFRHWSARKAIRREERARQRRAGHAGSEFADIRSVDGAHGLRRLVLEKETPWRRWAISSCEIPGMISDEERRYYSYIGQFYSGKGRAVELGPWLGCSTHYIVEGLIGNPNFRGEHLHVFDDFIWRSDWMDPIFARYGGPADARPQNHASFRALFDEYTRPLSAWVETSARRLSVYQGNEGVEQLAWNDGPVEVCYVDCGRTFEVNNTWYSLFRPHFLPGRTLLIMQDWQTYKEVPAKWYNQLKQFTDSKATELELVHEVRGGGVATFLYRGA